MTSAFTPYYVAIRLRDGAIKTSIEAERTAYDAMLAAKDGLFSGTWEAIGVYTNIPTLAAWDGDSRHQTLLLSVIQSTFFHNDSKAKEPEVASADLSFSGRLYTPLPVLSYSKRHSAKEAFT